MHPQQLIARWVAWDEYPGDASRAGALVSAINAYVGLDSATAFRRHVNAQRHAGLSLPAAIYTWTPT